MSYNCTGRAALLFVGFLVVSPLFYLANVSKLLFLGRREQVRLPSTQQQSGRRLQSNKQFVAWNNEPATTRHQTSGRRLQAFDAATRQKQRRSYLGSLHPPVDASNLPRFLRDTLAEPEAQDIVFFWHIPKASGSTVKNVLNFCFDLKRAEQLKETPSMEFARNNILNMDTSSPDGLEFSFANQIANSGKVDVIVSNYFLSGAALFTNAHNGKTFTILRHPAEVALSLFHYRRKATWERSYRKDFNQMTFRDYVNSDYYISNWMVRQLTATEPWVEINQSHLERARHMLKQKVFVGEIGQMDETFRQLQAHFGWKATTSDCVHTYLHQNPTNTNTHGDISGGRGGTAWKILVGKEKWDMSLYYYGLELFAEQSSRYPPHNTAP